MSTRDKAKNAGRNATGKAKEVAGRISGNRRTEQRGRRDQVKADLKDAGEQLKDTGGKIKDAHSH
jgi:uncharacterized protein YjbJ (UPF0337 family)